VSRTAGTWGDLHNVRDLDGLTTGNGTTRSGRIFRSPSPDGLSRLGWRDLQDDGVLTLIDLRNDDEVSSSTERPASVTVVRRPIEDQSDDDFMAEWGDRLGSPAYYPEILKRWPQLVSNVFIALADAPDGAVLIHCGAGRDRTGMIASMLLELAGVDRVRIYDDYCAAVRSDNVWLRSSPPNRREHPKSDEELEVHLAEARSELAAFLDALEVETFLIAAGVTPGQVSRLKSRLLDD
jgi:protein-tyrosine phosphatase